MIAETLQKSFALANHRFLLIFVDMFWKTVWLAVTLAMVFLAATWFGSSLQSIAWESVPALDTLIAGSLLRQLWNTYAVRVALASAGIALASAVIWLFLEAYFRSRMLSPGDSRTGSFNLFLVSNVLKLAALGSAAMFFGAIVFARFFSAPIAEWPLVWAETRGAALISILILTFLTYFLVTIDTLVRSDAIELLGADLLGVSGVIGILFVFEAFILSAAGVSLLAGFLNISRFSELLGALVFVAVAIAFLSILHSYLLVVRFSAVGLMKRGVTMFL